MASDEQLTHLYESVPVGDGLAGERTSLAAERTLLAYARTAFALFVGGVTAGQLLTNWLIVALGYTLAVTSCAIFLIGVWRYRKSRAATRRMLKRLLDESQQK